MLFSVVPAAAINLASSYDSSNSPSHVACEHVARMRLKCEGTRAETRFRLSAKRTSPFKSEGASVQSTTGSRGLRISGSNAGYTTFRGSVKGTGYPLHSPVSPSLPLPCVTMCHHISTGLLPSVSRPTVYISVPCPRLPVILPASNLMGFIKRQSKRWKQLNWNCVKSDLKKSLLSTIL